MRLNNRIAAGIASAALVLGVGAGIADAAQSTAAKKGNVAGQHRPGPGAGAVPGAKAIGTYLGLTAAELRTQLQAGKTPAQVAVAQGKTVSGLEDAIVADAKAHLDADVASDKLTAAQAATILANITSRVSDMVTRTGPPPGGGLRGHRGPGPGPAVTSFLGLTAAELRTQLQAGKTLAQVAVAQGKTVAALKDAIVADAKTHLDADVAAGKLSAAKAATMLANLTSHVDDMVNRTGPSGGVPGGHRGPGGPGGPGFAAPMTASA